MRLAFSTNAFKKYPLEESIKAIADIGYTAVEILCDIPHAYPPKFGEKEIQSVKSVLSEYNIEISNLNAFTLFAIRDTQHPSWIENDQRQRGLRIQHTINCIHLARKIGAKNISTQPGGPIDKNTGNNREQLETVFVDELSKVVPIAEENKVKILVEPEPKLLLENSEHFLNFIKNINSDYVKLNFDIGHFFCVNENPATLINKLADYIEHFHLADIASNRIHNHLIPGQGAIDFHSVFDAIHKINYKGFVTVELYPYQENPIEAAKIAYKYLKNIIS
jgi:sugar phosphate isomerase/epimerase